jgi:ketosteroid isomerase-like protein
MDEIIELDNQRIEAMTKQDVQALDRILADDLSYTHSTARVETKAEFIAALTSGRTKYESIERDDVKVRQYGDTAVVTGLAKFHVNANGNDIKFQTRFPDVYSKRNGVWQMVAWQSTKIPD